MRSFRVFGLIVVVVTLVTFITACGEEDPAENEQNQAEPSEVTCEATAECEDSEVCADGVCTDEPSSGDECAENEEMDEFGEFICLDGQWRDIDDLEGPSIESLTAEPTSLGPLESADLDAEVNNPYDVELSFQWSVDDSDWQLDADGPEGTVTAPAEPEGAVEITLEVGDLWDNGATDSVTVEVAEVEDCSFTSSPFGGGEGTEESPWTICTAQHFNTLQSAQGVLEGHFELKANIELDEEFSVLGDEDNHFSGHFDGNGYAVANLMIDAANDEQVGLFSEIAEDGVVENLTLENVDISGDRVVGALAGGTNIPPLPEPGEGSHISNVHVSGDVEGSDWYIGGLVGSNSGHISNSTSEVTVVSDSSFVGGITGSNGGNALIDDTLFEGIVEGGNNAGGIAGRNHGLIEASASLGDVESSNSNVGGVAGSHSGGVIEQSHSSGTIVGERRVGGLAGLAESDTEISDTFSKAVVELVEDPRWGGGLVGRLWGGVIERSWAAGPVSASEVADLGGLVAGSEPFDEDGETLIEKSYWDTETSNLSHSDGGEGLETAEFGNEANFDEWDFNDVWLMEEDSDDNDRPMLIESPVD